MPSRRISASDTLAPLQEISLQPVSSYNSDNVNMLTRIVTGERDKDFIVNGLDLLGINTIDTEISELPTYVDEDTNDVLVGIFSTDTEYDALWDNTYIEYNAANSVLASVPDGMDGVAAHMVCNKILPVTDIGYKFKISFTISDGTPYRIDVQLGAESYSYDYPGAGTYNIYLELNNSSDAILDLSISAMLWSDSVDSTSSCVISDISILKILNDANDIEPIAVKFDNDNSADMDHSRLPMTLLHPHHGLNVSEGIAIKDEAMINMLPTNPDVPVSTLNYGDAASWIHNDPFTVEEFPTDTSTLVYDVTNSEYKAATFNSSGLFNETNKPSDDGSDIVIKVSGITSQTESVDGSDTTPNVQWAYVCIYYSYFKNSYPNNAYIGLARESTITNAVYGEDYMILGKLRFIDAETVDAIIYYPDRQDWGYIDATQVTYNHINKLKHWIDKPVNTSLALDILASTVYNFKGMLFFQDHSQFSDWIGADNSSGTDKYITSDNATGVVGVGHGPTEYMQWKNGADPENSYDLCAYVVDTNSFWRSQILTDESGDPIMDGYNLTIIWSELTQKAFELNWTDENSGEWPSSIPTDWSYYNGSWDESPTLLTYQQSKDAWPDAYYGVKSEDGLGFSKINPFNPTGVGMVSGPTSSEVVTDHFLRSDGLWISPKSQSPVGSIIMWTGDITDQNITDTIEPDAAPGWLVCAGQTITEAEYPDLWNALSSYSGNSAGDSSRNIPDLRSQFIVGVDNRDDTYILGETGGEDSVTLLTSQIPSHLHENTISNTLNISTDGHSITLGSVSVQSGSGTQVYTAWNGQTGSESNAGTIAQATITPEDNHEVTVTGDISITNISAGGDGAHENRPPFTALIFLIKI